PGVEVRGSAGEPTPVPALAAAAGPQAEDVEQATHAQCTAPAPIRPAGQQAGDRWGDPARRPGSAATVARDRTPRPGSGPTSPDPRGSWSGRCPAPRPASADPRGPRQRWLGRGPCRPPASRAGGDPAWCAPTAGGARGRAPRRPAGPPPARRRPPPRSGRRRASLRFYSLEAKLLYLKQPLRSQGLALTCADPEFSGCPALQPLRSQGLALTCANPEFSGCPALQPLRSQGLALTCANRNRTARPAGPCPEPRSPCPARRTSSARCSSPGAQ